MQNSYYLAILKFCSKLINNNLPHYFDDFMPHFSIGATNYNIRDPDLQLPRIRHKFPRSSLRYQLISTLNETSPEIMKMAKIARNIFLLITSEKVLWMGTGTRVKIQIVVTHAAINILICM